MNTEDPLIPNKLVLVLLFLGISMFLCRFTPAFASEQKSVQDPNSFNISQLTPTPTPTPVPTQRPWVYTDFPYVSQKGDGATYKEDCGSASILMVAEFYELGDKRTVDEVHKDMMGGDFPSSYIAVAGYLENTYGLETEIIVNEAWIKTALENVGFDTSMIKVVEEIPEDSPVIWVYSTVAHWIVRYKGWTFDPNNGIWLFEETEDLRNINNPEIGLGIVVHPGHTQPKPIVIPDMTDLVFPETIRVRRTFSGECGDGKYDFVETIDFKEYVKGVLAGEWGNRWHTNSIKVGAIAVKMYGWSAIEKNGKWQSWSPEFTADVYDCDWDQFYKPEWRTEKTDRIVDETWDYILLNEDGSLVQTYFNAWEEDCEMRGQKENCMGQWDTLRYAREGIDWKNILLSYYDDAILITMDQSFVQNRIIRENNYQPVDGEYEMYCVKEGDTLSSIASEFIGAEETAYIDLFNFNTDVLDSMGHVVVGECLAIPPTVTTGKTCNHKIQAKRLYSLYQFEFCR